jgi:hypothetical protein
MHAVATQAVFIESALCVMNLVGEDPAVSGAVGARVPRGVLALVTPAAARRHFDDVDIAKVDRFGQGSEEMNPDMADLGREACFVAVETVGITMCRAMHHAGRGCHLVAACTALTVL